MQKYQHLFDTEQLEHNLKGKSLRGGLSTFAGQGLTTVLRIGSTMVLARILIPEYFGLISMITALTAFAERFKDLGLSIATIQRKEITHEQVSTLFWINLGVGTLIMILFAVLSHVIAWFYGDNRLIYITIAISSSFFWGGLTIQHSALLRRQMHFTQLAWIQIVSTGLSIALAIGLAWQGFQYWALVWREVSRSLFIAAGTWLMCRWLPSLPSRKVKVKAMLRFGRDITGFNIIWFMSRSFDRILIGKWCGASPLGFYSQAYQLMSLPMNQLEFPVTCVAESTLSVLNNDPPRYRQYYKKLIAMLSFVAMPLTIYLCIFSENIILLFLGDQWIEAASIFKILAIAAFIQPIANTCGFVMVTCGKTRRYFLWGIMNALFFVSAFSIGLHWGAKGVATGYTIATYVILFPSLRFSFRNTPVSISLFLEAIFLPALSSLIMAIFLILITHKITWLNSSTGIFASLFLSLSFYCGFWMLFPGAKQKLFEYISYSFTALQFVPSFRRSN